MLIGILSSMAHSQAELSVQISIAESDADYALLDSGNGKKFEQFGQCKLIRPEPEAFWKIGLPEQEWESAHAEFISGNAENQGYWKSFRPHPQKWPVQYANLSLLIEQSSSRHVGLFPEQAPQWDFIRQKIKLANRKTSILNLFGYTGAATMAAAQAGAVVTHVDASKRALEWAKENQKLSGLENASIRWILDDAFKFVSREVRRGSKYDGLILDPPKFGRGPKGEVWEFYKILPVLLEHCQKLLSANPLFVILTAYAVKASSITLGETMRCYFGSSDAELQFGELAQREKSSGRLLPRAIYSIWQKE